MGLGLQIAGPQFLACPFSSCEVNSDQGDPWIPCRLSNLLGNSLIPPHVGRQRPRLRLQIESQLQRRGWVTNKPTIPRKAVSVHIVSSKSSDFRHAEKGYAKGRSRYAKFRLDVKAISHLKKDSILTYQQWCRMLSLKRRRSLPIWEVSCSNASSNEACSNIIRHIFKHSAHGCRKFNLVVSLLSRAC